eukprot:gene17092-23388_t
MDENKTFSFNFSFASNTGGDTPAGDKTDSQKSDDAHAKGCSTAAALKVGSSDGITLNKGRVETDTAATILEDVRLKSHDLIPRVYEGGFKLWEGAIDLCSYLVQTYKLAKVMTSKQDFPELKGKQVLELGCGHALPGILLLLAGADVHFQDYNKEVLTKLSLPNALSNMQRLPKGRAHPSMRFFAGCWSTIGGFLSSKGLGRQYDVVLTSESIYDLTSQPKLLACIKQTLCHPMGVAYIASKSYYFGVGGGTNTFCQLVKEDGVFQASSVFKVEDTIGGNVREIIKLTYL